MDEERLKQIQERCEKATRGPWTLWVEHLSVYAGDVTHNEPGFIRANGKLPCVCKGTDDEDGISEADAERNADFIAHARQDVPDLVAEVKRLREIILSCRERIREHRKELGRPSE